MDTSNEMMETEDMADNNINDNDDDEIVDDVPDFVQIGSDAVEVHVDDDQEPMDDDDEGNAELEDNRPAGTIVPDMAELVLTSHTDAVYAVACHANGQSTTLRIVSGGGDDQACWHTVTTATTTATTTTTTTTEENKSSHNAKLVASIIPLQPHHKYTDSVTAIAFNAPFVAFDPTKPPNPEWIAVGAMDGSIVLYRGDLDEQQQSSQQANVVTLEGPGSDIEWLCWHPKGGNVLLVGSADGTVWMYHTALQKCLQVFVGHEAAVTCGAFSSDGKWALSASADGTLRVWAPKTGKCRHAFRFATVAVPLTCLAIQPASSISTGGDAELQNQLVVVGSDDGYAHVCHVGTKKHVASLRHYEPSPQTTTSLQEDEDDEQSLPSSVEAVGFSPSHPQWCATGGMDGVLKIWDLANQGQCRHSCVPPQAAAAAAAANARTQNTMGNGITRLQWHPTFPLVFTATCQGCIHLWDARNGQLVHTLTGHSDVINDMDVQFTMAVASIVTASDDGTVRVFIVDIDAALRQPQS